METDVISTTDEIMFAIFDGEQELTEAVYYEVKKFAAYVKQREGYGK